LINGSSTETALYDALGQRIRILGGVNGTVLYAYDEAGHLVGEYDGSGALIEDTVWLGDTPVATLRPSGSTVSIYYVLSDALSTPRQITRPSDNALRLGDGHWGTSTHHTPASRSRPRRLRRQAMTCGNSCRTDYARNSNPCRWYRPAG